jgi:hypothetical protein
MGRSPGNASRLFAYVVLLGLLALGLCPATVFAARTSQPVCVRRSGIPHRECPKVRRSPRLVSLAAETPIAPVLVGNSYAVDGVAVSEMFHFGERGQEPGPDPERRDYNSFVSFDDPDGNGWLVQEVKRA